MLRNFGGYAELMLLGQKEHKAEAWNSHRGTMLRSRARAGRCLRERLLIPATVGHGAPGGPPEGLNGSYASTNARPKI
jgi:hypothetical protein